MWEVILIDNKRTVMTEDDVLWSAAVKSVHHKSFVSFFLLQSSSHCVAPLWSVHLMEHGATRRTENAHHLLLSPPESNVKTWNRHKIIYSTLGKHISVLPLRSTLLLPQYLRAKVQNSHCYPSWTLSAKHGVYPIIVSYCWQEQQKKYAHTHKHTSLGTSWRDMRSTLGQWFGVSDWKGSVSAGYSSPLREYFSQSGLALFGGAVG